MNRFRSTDALRDDPEKVLDELLAAACQQTENAVQARLTAQGGLPELRDPDLALARLLAGAHRQVGRAVSERLKAMSPQPVPAERNQVSASGGERSALMQSHAIVRLKYRQEALAVSQAFWPRDLTTHLGAALVDVRRLVAELDYGNLLDPAVLGLGNLDRALRTVSLLPEPLKRPAPLAGDDYIGGIEDYLDIYTARLFSAAGSVRQLLAEEVEREPSTDKTSGYCVVVLEVTEVAQDLLDDLEKMNLYAAALARAVSKVEEASTDFRGADLRHAQLGGLKLKGIRWDKETVWPEEWQDRIFRVSELASEEQGVLVVGLEPRDSTVSADA